MIEIPKNCPSCGSTIEIIGPKMFCRNKECSAQSFGRIKKSLKIMGILGIGDGILSSLINEYEIETSLDLIKVMMHDNLWPIENISKVKIGAAALGLSRAIKIREEFKTLSSGVPLSVFIDSLQITFLGTSNSERVAEFCNNSLEKFLKLDTNTLLSIDKIGPEMSEAIMVGINQNREMIPKLIKYIPIKQNKPEPEIKQETNSVPAEKQTLGGASFCISGKLSQQKSYYYDIIIKVGGEAHPDLKSDTTYLVIDDSGVETNKVKKAKKSGINIITENDLKRILGIT